VRLTEEGLVSCREEHRSGKPDRKVYSITEKGRAALLEALRETPAPDKFRSEFLFLMSCAGLLDRDRVARAIDERIAFHNAQIAKLSEAMECCGSPASHFVIGYGQAVYSAARRYLADHRDAALDLAGGEAPLPEAAEHGDSLKILL
jgi:hypothetical protein